MARAVHYLDCFDSGLWFDIGPDDLDTDIGNAGLPCLTSMAPTPYDYDAGDTWVLGSRVGSHLTTTEGKLVAATQNESLQAQQAVTTYAMWMQCDSHTFIKQMDIVLLCSDRRNFTGSPSTGAVRLIQRISDAAGTFWFILEVFNGTTWSAFFTETGTTHDIGTDYTTQELWQLQVDTTNKQARVVRGSTIMFGGWKGSVTIAAAGVTLPGSWGGMKAGSGSVLWKCSSYFVTSCLTSDTDAGATPNELANFQVTARYVSADQAGANWTATGTLCSGLWRALDDVEDDQDGANDYISTAATAGAKDQLFSVVDAAGAETVIGVAICEVVTSLQGGQSLLANISGGTTIAYTPQVGFQTLTGDTHYAFLQGQPNGAGAWSASAFNNLQIGVRVPASTAGKCWGLFAMFLGENVVRQASKAGACPSGFVPKVMIM